MQKVLCNFSSPHTLMAGVSNIDKEDGADIKAQHLPISSLLFQQRFTSSTCSMPWKWCQLLQVPLWPAREEEAEVCVNTPCQPEISDPACAGAVRAGGEEKEELNYSLAQ